MARQATAAIESGTHVAPRDAPFTVAQWCEVWLDGYAVHRASTVAQARVHVRRIVAEFGDMPLSALRPSQVKGWMAGPARRPRGQLCARATSAAVTDLLRCGARRGAGPQSVLAEDVAADG